MQAIERVPVVQQAADCIEKLINEEEYPAGAKLPAETELCRKLGVGRGTVREAYRLLHAKGVVELRPSRGAFVAQNDPSSLASAINWLVENEKELLDSFEVRTALEPMAARFTAIRSTEEERKKLEEIHTAFLNAIDEGDSDKIAQLDEEFHSMIVLSSGNALLQSINLHVIEGMKTFRNMTFQVEQNVKNAVMPHSNIMNAILVGDYNQAEREMRSHLEKVREDLSLNISGQQ